MGRINRRNKWMTKPTTQEELQILLGSVGYYRKFISNFTEVIKPLLNLVKAEVIVNWTSEGDLAFFMIQQAILSS